MFNKHSECLISQIYSSYFIRNCTHLFFFYLAGKVTTNDELEEMLESGNPAIFTQGVSPPPLYIILLIFIL